MTNYDLSGEVCSEGFTISRFDNSTVAINNGVSPDHAVYFAHNVWPPVEDFHYVMTAWSERVRELGAQMMRMFALALDLPIDYFDRYTELDASTSTIRLYPARHTPLQQVPTVIWQSSLTSTSTAECSPCCTSGARTSFVRSPGGRLIQLVQYDDDSPDRAPWGHSPS